MGTSLAIPIVLVLLIGLALGASLNFAAAFLAIPIVAFPAGEGCEVVDGFHRNRVGREGDVAERLAGYLPVTLIKSDRQGREVVVAVAFGLGGAFRRGASVSDQDRIVWQHGSF